MLASSLSLLIPSRGCPPAVTVRFPKRQAMKSTASHVLSLLALSVLALGQSSPTLKRGAIVDNYSKLPLIFEQNEGQAEGSVKFLSRGSGYTLFLTPDEAVFSLRGDQVVRMQLVDSNLTAKVGG